MTASDSRQQALAKFCPYEDRIRPVERPTRDMWGLLPQNREQKLALAALADHRIKLITLVGKAGTGKTLLAIAAGLQSVTEERSANKLIVARPVISLGKDLGYLPAPSRKAATVDAAHLRQRTVPHGTHRRPNKKGQRRSRVNRSRIVGDRSPQLHTRTFHSQSGPAHR